MGPKSTEAYNEVRRWIESGELKPGQKLPSERRVERENLLPVRRTALKTVLRRLVSDGYIEVYGRSSYRVAGGVVTPTPEGLEPWKTHGQRRIYENKWMDVDLVDVEPPGVDRFEHHVVRLQHVAISAILDDEDRVLMLWRYRFVPEQWGWELPGGIVDAGEDAKAAALREVEEETGWRPESLEHVVTFQPVVGMVDSPHEIFVGRGAEQVGGPTDVEEAGHIEWVPLADVRGLMNRGDLMGSGTLVALLHILANRGRYTATDD